MDQYEFLLMLILPITMLLSWVRNSKVSKKIVQPETDTDDGEICDYINVREHNESSARTTGMSSGTVNKLRELLASKIN